MGNIRSLEEFKALALAYFRGTEGDDFNLDGYDLLIKETYAAEGQIPLEDWKRMTKTDPTWLELNWRCLVYPKIESLLCLEG